MQQGCTPTLQVFAVYYRQQFRLFSIPEFARILLTLDDPVHNQLLEKIHRIKRIFTLCWKMSGRHRLRERHALMTGFTPLSPTTAGQRIALSFTGS